MLRIYSKQILIYLYNQFIVEYLKLTEWGPAKVITRSTLRCQQSLLQCQHQKEHQGFHRILSMTTATNNSTMGMAYLNISSIPNTKTHSWEIALSFRRNPPAICISVKKFSSLTNNR